MVVVECLPFIELAGKVSISGVVQQLIELLPVCQMRALHFAVEMRAGGFYVTVNDAAVLRMPVKL